jgi:N-carbamoylputrescine amidase
MKKLQKNSKRHEKTGVVLGLIQLRCSNDPDANLGKTLTKIDEAADQGAQIICLQELFRSLYFPQTENAKLFDLAETIPGPTTKKLSAMARRKKVVIVGSIFEKRTQGIYHNTSVIINTNGEITGMYRKMHIPDDPCFYEKFYFTPGDLGFHSFQTQYGRVGSLVCWDQWFPEAARLMSLAGAQIIFYPTAIGWNEDEKPEVCKVQYQAWETIQRAHAIANGVYVAVVNRIGQEGKLKFWGGSFVAGPFGEILARADHEKEQVLIVKCDFNKIDETRHGWPFLRDRRIDAYQELTARFRDIVKS